jgi:hypothetical protein
MHTISTEINEAVCIDGAPPYSKEEMLSLEECIIYIKYRKKPIAPQLERYDNFIMAAHTISVKSARGRKLSICMLVHHWFNNQKKEVLAL